MFFHFTDHNTISWLSTKRTSLLDIFSSNVTCSPCDIAEEKNYHLALKNNHSPTHSADTKSMTTNQIDKTKNKNKTSIKDAWTQRCKTKKRNNTTVKEAMVMVLVFNATFNIISVITWQSVSLVENNGISGENVPTCLKSLTNFIT